MARALVSISTRYSGEEGKKRLLAQGYQPEMVEETGGAGTRCVKMRAAWDCSASSASTGCTA